MVNIDPTLDLEQEILRLKKEMNAVILAHYYQDDDIQDIADFIGDSLELSRKAAETDADVIIFCGVKFMAEVAKILSPQKTVLLPDLKAGCSLEDSCKTEDFIAYRKKLKETHPDHLALTYINCSAEVKAASDIIVTSSSAEKIISKIPKDTPILFSPDKHLGGYLAKKTGREMMLWNGTCIVHEQFSEKELVSLRNKHEKAHIIAHPECPESLLQYADFTGSTSALLKFVGEHKGDDFIVLTEPGIIHQMKKSSPESIFHSVPGIDEQACAYCNNCEFMKMNTMEKLYQCLKDLSPTVEMEEATRARAELPLVRMLEQSK